MSLEFREEMERLSSAIGGGARQTGAADVEKELTEIFGDSGKKVILMEFAERYGVAAADAIRRPGAFHTALFYLLGEMGSTFVMDRINKRVWGPAPAH
jgi:hypothetical protein